MTVRSAKTKRLTGPDFLVIRVPEPNLLVRRGNLVCYWVSGSLDLRAEFAIEAYGVDYVRPAPPDGRKDRVRFMSKRWVLAGLARLIFTTN